MSRDETRSDTVVTLMERPLPTLAHRKGKLHDVLVVPDRFKCFDLVVLPLHSDDRPEVWCSLTSNQGKSLAWNVIRELKRRGFEVIE